MSTFKDFKCVWERNIRTKAHVPFDRTAFTRIVKMRAKKHMNVVMRYFWASFALQILVYALLSHTILKYGSDPQTLLAGLAGIILFIPFTFVLIRKFKAMAVSRMGKGTSGTSVHNYVATQYDLLESFYRFKKKYELLLVPASTAIGTFLTFKLYVPGGVMAYQTGALLIFSVAIISCVGAIRSENKKSFDRPLADLRKLKDDLSVSLSIGQ
jgi:hypothetical protein